MLTSSERSIILVVTAKLAQIADCNADVEQKLYSPINNKSRNAGTTLHTSLHALQVLNISETNIFMCACLFCKSISQLLVNFLTSTLKDV